MQLLSSTTFVDTNHSNSNRPSSFTNTESKIPIVGIDVAPFLGCFDDFDDRFQDALVEITLLKFAEKLDDVSWILMCNRRVGLLVSCSPYSEP